MITTKIAIAGVIATLLFAAVPPGTQATAPDQTLADQLRAYVATEAEKNGIDPAIVFAAEVTLEEWSPSGTQQSTMTFDAALERLFGGRPAVDVGALGSVDSNGPAGTPEILVGDTLHLYVHFAIGCAPAGYRFTQSAVVPATPRVMPLGPLVLYDVGGPLYNVKGNYLLGLHTAGVLLGTGVTTAQDGPFLNAPTNPTGVLLGVLLDRSIDFVGHASGGQTFRCITFFGIPLFSIGAGTLLADGVAQFDARPIATPAGPVSTAFPRVP